MATSDVSPSLFTGRQWTDWACSVLPGFEASNVDTAGTEDNDTSDLCTATESMKLKTDDMPLFGVCPSRDEFYLVMCEKCNYVVKPQAFQAHLDARHGGKSNYSSTKSHQSSDQHADSVKSLCTAKAHSPSKTHSSKIYSKSAHSKNHSSATKPHHPRLPTLVIPLKLCGSKLKSSRSISAGNDTLAANVPHLMTAKGSVKEPLPSINTALKIGDDMSNHIVNDSKLKNYSSMPVVKVERIPESHATRKQHESSGCARTSLTYRSVSGHTSPPPMPVINATKPHLSPPHLSPPPFLSLAQEMDIGTHEVHSELDSAVSSILEHASPVLVTDDDFVAKATSLSTLTTNTVTMASLSASKACMTNVRNTSSSSFMLSSTSRPHFPLGSIHIHFSSTGVLSTITGDGNNNYSNNMSKSGSESNSVTNDPIRSSLCSNGCMESTISDIVKSAVSSRNTGGFKSLSPLLLSPSKDASSFSNNTFKYPSKFGGVVNSSSIAKSGTKLTGTTNVFESSSSGSFLSTSSSSSLTTASTEVIKKFLLLSKPDKIIPLKDREYNANKHCGVVVLETGKPCTRSLTCKSHALSMRRAVIGRRLPFDDLLTEHKEAKEAYIKAKIESKAAKAALKAASAANKGHAHHVISPINRIGSTTASSLVKPYSHLNQAKENRPLSQASFTTSKSLAVQRSASLSTHRPSFGSIGSPSFQDELLSRTSMKPGANPIDIEDGLSLTYHPRPIAACLFGARNHSVYSGGLGCYSFGRRSDHMRSAFLDLLDRHTTDPSPPKKPCLDVDLRLEKPDRVHCLSDQHDLSFPDMNCNNNLDQMGIQGTAGLISSAPNTVPSKHKWKSESATSLSDPVSWSKSKSKVSIHSPKSAGVSNAIGSMTQTLLTSSSMKTHRENDGMISQTAINVHSSLGTTLVTDASILENGNVSNSADSNATQYAIAIPGVNISHLGASVMAKHANTVIPDIGNTLMTEFPHDLLNRQIVNFTNSVLTTDVSVNQIQSVTHNKCSKPFQRISVINNSKSLQQPKFINTIDVGALQVSKAGIFASLSANALLLDGNLQSGTVLHPVTLTAATTASSVLVGNVVFSQHQSSPFTVANAISHYSSPATATNTLPQHHSNLPTAAANVLPHHFSSLASAANTPFLSSAGTPHVYTSSMPNGMVSSLTDKGLVMSHCNFVPQSKSVCPSPVQASRTTFQQRSPTFTGTHFHSHAFPASNSTTLSNQISGTSNLTTNQIAQLHLNNAGLHKQSINKLTVQPVSITVPYVTQNNVGGVEMGVGHQHHTHPLFMTSDDKQSLHLQYTDQPKAQSSPTSSLMS